MTDPPRRRHVWVDSSGGFRYPGLVIAWRRVEGSTTWQAYVARAHRDGGALVTWELASQLHLVADERWDSSTTT